jgi:hypothetical protein
MRKLFGVFLLLIILGGTVFFFGWAQFGVPPGSYGLIRSKTHGVDPRLVREGEFRWIWYKLIPTNVQILVFSPDTVTRPLPIRGSLPSGDMYARFVGVEADFTYEIAGSISFNIKADALPELVIQGGVADQEELEALEQRIADEIAAMASRFPQQYMEEGAGPAPAGEREMLGLLEREIAEAYPEIENVVCAIRELRFPDAALYRSVRSLYEAYIERQHRLLELAVSAQADRHIAAQIRFDELAKYGELLTKYPVLLQYLAQEKDLGPPEAGGDR